MEEREEFLTAKQLAQILQVSESTVRRLALKRRIPSVRLTPHIIRFHLDAVREALKCLVTESDMANTRIASTMHSYLSRIYY
jgi:excisionase family DNA binding protein